MRIHRGKPQEGTNSSGKSKSSSTGRDQNQHHQRSSTKLERKHEKIKISISYPSNEQLPPSPTTSMSSGRLHLISLGRDNSFCNRTSATRELSNSSSNNCLSRDGSPSRRKRMGKRNIKVQVKKFRTETKAAKTLGIIVSAFILCWFPFFTVYLIRAFCEDCIESLLFSILFWLGYCNSALNPLIYALFSKDFRNAFKQILFCTKQTDKSIRVLIESTAQNLPFFKPKLDFSNSPPHTYQNNSSADDNDFSTLR